MKNIYLVLLIFIIAILSIIFGIEIGKMYVDNIPNDNFVPIQTYDEVVNYLHYVQIVSYTKDIIIQDLLVNDKIDTSFVNKLSIHLSVNKKLNTNGIEKHKTIILNDIDSIYNKWLLSIPFMFGDDSTKVLESDSYKRILKLNNYENK